MTRIVFDIGGSHLRMALVDGNALKEIEKIKTPSSPGVALTVFAEYIERIAPGKPVECIAGGVAGVISNEGMIVVSPNLPQWTGFALAENLRSRFGVRVIVKNDAELGGLGEALSGAGKGSDIVAYLTLGTGVGGARVVDGVIDAHAIGFEPGHQIVEVSRNAPLGSLIGGAALTRIHGTPPEMLPREVWDTLTPILAAGVWNAIVHWSPHVVVLGGALMNETTAFRLTDVEREMEKYRGIIPILPPIRTSALGDNAGLHGALVVSEREHN